jgi:hypothetical protein
MASRRRTVRRKPAKSPKPFRAADHPGRDYRGEKVVKGVKYRV